MEQINREALKRERSQSSRRNSSELEDAVDNRATKRIPNARATLDKQSFVITPTFVYND